MVLVKLFATLRNGRDKSIEIEHLENMCVGHIVDKLEIPREDVAIMLVNGRHKTFETLIYDEDLLAIFPPVGGG